MVFSLWLWPTTKSTATKIHVKCWQFQWPCGYAGAMWGALPNGAHPWLHAKPLDAAIGRVPMPYCPGSRHGWRFQMKHKNTNKAQLLASYLTVDWRKKAKQFWDPKRTFYSAHQCNKLCWKLQRGKKIKLSVCVSVCLCICVSVCLCVCVFV